MAKTNYSYEKRGRELEKQKKQAEKRQKNLIKRVGIQKSQSLVSLWKNKERQISLPLPDLKDQ